jgi:AcrR family transcriptional regulator
MRAMSTIEPITRQEARKAKTRLKILDAARILFTQVGYTATTIDQITNLAGVGRGTFYMHFTGKAALLQEMLLDFRNEIFPLLQELGDYTSVDELHVCVWINKYIEFLVSHSSSVLAMSNASHAGENAFFGREQWHALALDAFGSRIPAFRIAAQRIYLTLTARAQLIIFQVEGFATACAFQNWSADRNVMVSELAKTIMKFIAQTGEMGVHEAPIPAIAHS